MPPDERPSPFTEWLVFAAEDLGAAEVPLGAPGHERAACFHAQQCAEKALKGHLVRLGAQDVPRTHDLEAIASLIAAHGGPTPAQDCLDELADFGVAPRYPGSRSPLPQDAARAVEAARAVLCHVRRAVGLETEEDPA